VRDTLAALAAPVSAALGSRVTGATRLPGGSKKGVYRLTFDDRSTAVLYRWDAAESYWPADAEPEPFTDASGAHLYEAANSWLTRAGVRTPSVRHLDVAAGFAVVEDLRGGTLEALLRDDRAAARPVLDRLAGTLRVLREEQPVALGKVHPALRHRVARGATCADLVHARATRDLAEAAARVPRLGAARAALAARLGDLRRAVRPRDTLALVHGELGPDHVLVGPGGEPVLIDIEGLMAFDVEWEHAFLRLRFGAHYPALAVDDLDEDRLRLYALAQHLSLVAGPLRLLDGDFPDRAAMRAIAESNADRALALLG
jgi:hypothetical protein